MARQMIDITGLRFGRLVVLRQANPDAKGVRYWLSQCDCGNQTVTTSVALRSGNTKSCGCYRREFAAEVGRNAPHPGRPENLRRGASDLDRNPLGQYLKREV